MQFNHEKIDYIAVSIFIFCIMFLSTLICQCVLRMVLHVQYPDSIIVCVSVLVAFLVMQKPVVIAISRFIHRIFGLAR